MIGRKANFVTKYDCKIQKMLEKVVRDSSGSGVFGEEEGLPD